MEISRLQPCIQLQLSKEELESIIDKAKDWALMHGIDKYIKFIVHHCSLSKMYNNYLKFIYQV